jgi:hypothetical protein
MTTLHQTFRICDIDVRSAVQFTPQHARVERRFYLLHTWKRGLCIFPWLLNFFYCLEEV